MKYFDISEVIQMSPETTLFNIVGKRGAGKTFSSKVYCVNNFIETGKKFLYVRRNQDEIKHSECADLFSDVWHNRPEIQKVINKRYNVENSFIDYWGGFFYIATSDGKKVNRLEKIGKAACVSKARSFKGNPYNDYSVILFDEVITDDGYFQGDKEPELFTKIIDTVARAENSTVKIILCGNPDRNVEACPYFYGLKIDYNKLKNNEIYYFNSKASTGKLLQNNIMFIKLAGSDSPTYLNVNTSGLFQTAESFMSYTGNVKTNKYNKFNDEIKQLFIPEYHLTVETAVILPNGRHKSIHAYYGLKNNQPALVVLGHDRLKADAEIHCRYDYLDPIDKDQPEMLRLGRNPLYTRFNRLMELTHALQNIYTDDDYNATTFFNILEDS